MGTISEKELHGLLSLSKRIENGADVEELWSSLDELAAVFGSSNWLYAVYSRDTCDKNYSFVCAVPPRWLQHYVGRSWHERDRALQHAARSSDIAQISQLPPAGDDAFDRAEASSLGIADGIVVPAFPAVPTLVGALLLYYPTSEAVQLHKALMGRPILRGFALAVLDHLLEEIRGGMLDELQLSAMDERVLLLGTQDMTSKQIARATGLDQKIIDRIFERIMRRLKVNRRSQAIQLVRAYRLV